MLIRVTVGDTWAPLALRVNPDETVAAVKARALAAQGIAAPRHARYEVKLGGALVRDESCTLAAGGVRPGAALVILSRRRRPVR
jgi:hypothetical protein